MNGRTVFGRTIGTGLAIRLAAVLAVVLLSVALIAPLALSGRTAAPSGSATSSASLRASGGPSSLSPAASTTPAVSADVGIPAFPSIAVDAAASSGALQPGDVAVSEDASGGKLLMRFRDVTQVANAPGIEPSAPGDVFLEITIDLKALSASTFAVEASKVFGGEELGPDSAWPAPHLPVSGTLQPGQIVSGKLGFEVPPMGQVTDVFSAVPGADLRLEMRSAPTGATPSPAPPNGWPVTFDSKGEPFVGPDGTVYVGNVALDASGHPVSSAHMALPGAKAVSVAAFGADGTTYMTGQTADQTATVLGAFGPDGRLLSGWPVTVESVDRVIPVATGGAYVVSSDNATATTHLFGPDGALRASWPFAADGSARAGRDGLYELRIADNAAGGHVEVLTTEGGHTSGRAADWQGLYTSTDGTVYAETWVLAAGSDTEVLTARIAAIGADGNPKPGWPVSITGSASAPAFGADGTVYLTLGASGVTSSILALDPSGRTQPGWPAKLPAGYTALSQTGGWHAADVAEAPIPGLAGTVYVAAEHAGRQPLVTAFDSSGRVEAGWPYRPSSGFTPFSRYVGGYSAETPPLFVRSGSTGLLYLALSDRIVALSVDGKVAPGWPKAFTGVTSWAATPGGGLVVGVTWYDAGSNLHITITGRTAAGEVAH
jgi:hypothetical protein